MKIGEWLGELVESSESTEEDGVMMQRFLRAIGFSKAIVTYGIVYPSGHGRPVSIQDMASLILAGQDKRVPKWNVLSEEVR